MEKAIEEELKGGDLKEEKAESKREGVEGEGAVDEFDLL